MKLAIAVAVCALSLVAAVLYMASLLDRIIEAITS